MFARVATLAGVFDLPAHLLGQFAGPLGEVTLGLGQFVGVAAASVGDRPDHLLGPFDRLGFLQQILELGDLGLHPG